ncbi:MAG: GNAT family N-acetyltransferase [Luteimonas sp.]
MIDERPPASIRRATEADVDAVAPLFDAYRQFYRQPPDLGRAQDWLRDRLQRNESVILVAEREGTAIGFTQLYPMFSSVRTARTWILNDLFIAKQARRCGVARALLDAAVRFARADGAAGIALETASDNAAARALYVAAGWQEETNRWYSLSLT